MRLIFATRPSALARWQTQWVITALQTAHPGLICEERILSTRGDKIIDKPLPELGGKGLFTQELETELLAGRVDCAVHSLKDLPIESLPELSLGAIPVRTDARDVLVSARGYKLATLPPNASIGTSSLRRAAQVLAVRPDLKVKSLRGNVNTRLEKALDGIFDAIVLAGAGMVRLGYDKCISEWLEMTVMLPAPGQGALAVQCRADDKATLSLLSALDDVPTRKAVTAERAFLQGLGGGCSLPVASYASLDQLKPGTISLTGLVISAAGKRTVRVTGSGTDPDELGADLAQTAIQQGGGELLKSVNADGSR